MKLLKIPALALMIAFCFALTANAQQKKQRTLADVYNDGVKLYEADRFEEAMKYFQYVKTKNPRNPHNMRYLKLTERALNGNHKRKIDLEKILKDVVVPAVDFEEASLGDVMAYISQRVEKLSDGKKSANFIYKGSAEQRANITVTLKLRNTPVTDVIRYVGSLSGTTFKYDEHAIVGTPNEGAAVSTSTASQTTAANKGFEESSVKP